VRYMFTIGFRPGSRDVMTAQMPAEQAHVRKLMAEGVIKAIRIAADQSRVWLELEAESDEHAHQTLLAFPLYPVMEAELTPLREPAPSRPEVESHGR
jgi:muconolactone delta-isomerase